MTTTRDIDNQLNLLTRHLRRHGVEDKITFHQGNTTYKVHNILMVGQTNIWPDGMAGCSKKEAFNALRVMLSGLFNFDLQTEKSRNVRNSWTGEIIQCANPDCHSLEFFERGRTLSHFLWKCSECGKSARTLTETGMSA